MPRGDGTGPFGCGPLTGRGQGQCRKPFWYAGRINLRSIRQLGSFVPFIGAIMWDIIRPNGLLRIVLRKLPSISNRKSNQIKNAVKTDFIVLDDIQDKNDKKEITHKAKGNNTLDVTTQVPPE